MLRILSIGIPLVLLTGVLYLVFSNYMSPKDGPTLHDEQIINPPDMIPEPILSSIPPQVDQVDEIRGEAGNIEQKTTAAQNNPQSPEQGDRADDISEGEKTGSSTE